LILAQLQVHPPPSSPPARPREGSSTPSLPWALARILPEESLFFIYFPGWGSGPFSPTAPLGYDGKHSQRRDGMQPFTYRSPFPSRRSPVMARRGMVATSHPLAVAAGLEMLREGGNAVDAAIAAAAALAVVEPTSNGLGSDAFALVWDGKRLHGLNASGRSPRALTPEVVRQAHGETMPTDGWLPVTVPGAVSGWVALSRRFGRLAFRRLLEPAIHYAAEGHGVPPLTAQAWQEAEKRFAHREDFRAAFLPGGRAPQAGQLFRLPDQARSLRLIAESEGEAFYRGELAEAMAAHAAREGGLLTVQDLAEHEPEWVEPLSVSHKGFRLWELPPNGQGLVALQALALLSPLDLG